MLLGIGLHAALSFYPTVWPVQDITADADGFFDEFVLFVHGFRMPLFFLLSGFFAALLWKRRGLPALLGHRLRRVVVPFILALVLIVPTVDWVSERAVEEQIIADGDIHAAVFLGNRGATEALLAAGTDANAFDAEGAYTPLFLAAVNGDVDMVELLLAAGAEPDLATADGLAIDAAAFMGREAAADALLAAGARDPRPPGQSWQELEWWGLGAGQVELEVEEAGPGAWLPSLHHLWFLWFLILFVIGFAPLAWLADRRAAQRGPDAPAARWPGWLMWALVPAVVLPQLAMEGGGAIPAFGPDTSIGWVPLPQVFAYYALFFAFGVLMYGRAGRSGALMVDSVGGRWWLILPLAVVVFVVGLAVTFEEGADTEPLASSLQVAYAWLMIFGLMGLFRAILSTERHGVRYLSDSSYWMYLAHLTLVIWLQSVVRASDLPAAVKFAIILLAASSLLLASYQLFVRYTPIGTLLNGKRTRPSRAAGTGTPVAEAG